MEFDIYNLNTPAVRHMLLAAALGALVGVEREHSHGEAPTHFGGVRTYPIIALMGAVSAWISVSYGTMIPLGAASLGVTALMVASYVVTTPREQSAGATSELSGLLVFLVGALCGLDHAEIGVVLGVGVAVLVGSKDALHGAVRRLGREDIASVLKLLFATFVVLPFLPDRPIDPWGALNPSSLWMLVILISGLGLLGYVAVRWLGPATGTTLTGALAGLISSTALTLSFVRRSKEETALRDALAAGILLSWSVMLVRVLVELAVVHAALLRLVAWPVGAGALVGAAAATVLHRRQSGRTGGQEIEVQNPFSLTAAIKFGLFFAFILVAVAVVGIYLPRGWMYAVAALAGTTDVDAITLSMARFARDGGDARLAAGSIVVAMLSNTVVKAGLVVALGERGLRDRVLAGAAGMTIAAGVVMLMVLAR